MNLADFRAKFPEFRSAPDPLVSKFLTDAALELNPTYWGTYFDLGHGYLTAAYLANAPNGQLARLDSDKATSTYKKAFEALRAQITFADRVV